MKPSRIFTAILLVICFIANPCMGQKATPKSKSKAKSGTTAKSNTATATKSEKGTYLFVGTFTKGKGFKSEGIYLYEMNPATGALKYVSVSTDSTNPAFLVIHPNKKWVYAVNEVGGANNKYNGSISAFHFNKEKKKLELINTVPSHGNGPCYISLDKSGKRVLTANYNSGTVALFSIGKNGSLGEATSLDTHEGKGPVADRQDSPHAHTIVQADNNFVYSADLGTDMVYVYQLDTVNGKLLVTNRNTVIKPGSGPRHLAFHPNKKWAYLINELKGTINAFNIDNSTGALKFFQDISTLPGGETKTAASADIHITPNGKYLYASNRGQMNNIAMYAINQESGMLSLIGHQPTNGKTPRNFVIDRNGKFLLVANQESSTIVCFKIDAATGKLIDTGLSTTVPNPVCLKLMY
jgi:6-phosphogluconolactonase